MTKMAFLASMISLIILAVFLRTFQLERESVWFDETVGNQATRAATWDEYMERASWIDPTLNPLYFVSLWGWCHLFGKTVIACRLYSVFLGTLSVVFLYLMALEYFRDAKEAYIAGLLSALSLTNIYFSQDIRMYSMYLMLTAASMWGLIRLLRHNDCISLAINVIPNMLLVWTHMMSCVFLSAQGLVVIWHYRKDLLALLCWGIPQAANTVVWYFYWFQYTRIADIQKASVWKTSIVWDSSYLLDAWSKSVSGSFFSPFSLGYQLGVIAAVASVLAAGVMVRRWLSTRTVPAEDILLLLMTCIPLLSFAFSKWIFPWWQFRYTIYVNLSIILMIVLATRAFMSAKPTVIAIVVVLFAEQVALAEHPFRPDWKTACEAISDDSPVWVVPGSQLETIKPLLNGNQLLPYYLDAKRQSVYDPAALARTGGWLVNALNEEQRFLLIQKSFEKKGIEMERVREISGRGWHMELWRLNTEKALYNTHDETPR